MAERDTHFSNAAVALFIELAATPTQDQQVLLLSRRLYDMAQHTLVSTGFKGNTHDNVPDITTWEGKA